MMKITLLAVDELLPSPLPLLPGVQQVVVML
jgi:hypothetical protein